MTDPGSVAAAYAVVLGGLSLYVVSVGRRVRAARRTANALRRERHRDAAAPVAEMRSASWRESSESSP